MTTKELRKSMVSDETKKWIEDMYTKADEKSSEGYASFLAEDCTLRFANNPEAQGRAGVVQALDYFYSTLKDLHHTAYNFFGDDNNFMMEGDVTYTRLDDNKVTMPFLTVFERNNEGFAKNVRIYIDLAPLYS